MKQLNMDLRKEWESLSTPELEEKLQLELEQDTPDDDVVLILLHILEKREPVLPVKLTPGEQEAWDRYRKKRTKGKKTPLLFKSWLSVAASLGLVCLMLLTVVPQKAEAETFWEMLQRITSTVMEFFNPGEQYVVAEMEYVFTTDNAGLQQVYDAVVELGITEPVVPMWLPEGAELIEQKPYRSPMSAGVCATFQLDEKEIVYKIDVYSGEPAHQYYRDDSHYEKWEWEGGIFHISRNEARWAVVWTNEKTECFLTLDCNEDTLRRILRSIYVMEAD